MDSGRLTLVALLAPVAAFLVLAIVAPLRRAGRAGAYLSILGAASSLAAAVTAWTTYDGAVTRLVWDWLPSQGRPLATIGVLADETSTVREIAYLAVYVPIRWLEWSVIAFFLTPGARTFGGFLLGSTARDRGWRLGGIALSCAADIPVILSVGGLPLGRFMC
jgi:hypothetical protein